MVSPELLVLPFIVVANHMNLGISQQTLVAQVKVYPLLASPIQSLVDLVYRYFSICYLIIPIHFLFSNLLLENHFLADVNLLRTPIKISNGL